MESPFNSETVAPMPASLWADTTAPAPAPQPLTANGDVDVVVVGAGFMGLAAALTLAEQSVAVAVLEASHIGWGASGRNNGLLTAGLKRDPDEVRERLGAPAERLLQLSGDAPAEVARLIEAHGIECDLRQNGWIQAAHSSFALPLIGRRVKQWQALGADVSLIDREEVRARIGSDYYAGAWIDRRGGSLNPLAYARGLARAARAAGATIYERSPVTDVHRLPDGFEVATPQGALHCSHVLACTNAYNQSLTELRGTVLPLRTAQVASAPLGVEQALSLLPGGEALSDTQRLLTSARLTADNRLIMGGASATAGDESRRLFDWLHRGARERFPQLGNIDWQYGWSGYLGLTHDHLPEITVVHDRYLAGIGCNGRGIAMATVTGQRLARVALGEAAEVLGIPVRKPRRIFGFSLRRPAVAAGVIANRMMDVAERRLGRR